MTSVLVDARLDQAVRRLMGLSSGKRVDALIREACARAIGLPHLPYGFAVGDPNPGVETTVAQFAEQFAVDVSAVTDAQRAKLIAALGGDTFRVATLMFIADFLPRVFAGLDALELESVQTSEVDWNSSDPVHAVFEVFLPAVARQRSLDPLTSELVRLRGAILHNCRLCKSRREVTALEAGGSEPLYGEVERFEESSLITERQKAALRFVDAMVWTPTDLSAAAAGVREHFTDEEAVELTLDIMRNASNKVAVALAADTPRVAKGTERYLIDADGQTVVS